MNTKICKKCNIEKDVSLFIKWKRTCKYCCNELNKKWKENNKKIIKSNCIDCNIEYETITYSSTHIPNIRCRKCSINSKKIIISEKECKVCKLTKGINDFYIGKICKKCLFIKRNKRYTERLKEDFVFRLKHNLKVVLKRKIKDLGLEKKDKMIDILDCTYSEFKLYLEDKFEDWMNWENYGKYNGELNYGWDIDHVIPLSLAKTEEDVIKLSHYTNLQPLCSKINRDIKKDNY